MIQKYVLQMKMFCNISKTLKVKKLLNGHIIVNIFQQWTIKILNILLDVNILNSKHMTYAVIKNIIDEHWLRVCNKQVY